MSPTDESISKNKTLYFVEGKLEESTMNTVILNTMNNGKAMTLDEVKISLVDLLISCAILPDSKVIGTDMFGRPTERRGLRGVFVEQTQELKQVLGLETFRGIMEEVMEAYQDKLQEVFDHEDGLHTNEEVDNAWNGIFGPPDLDAEFNSVMGSFAQVMSAADESQKRHDRMVMRLAIIDKLKKTGNEDMIEQVNDSLVERIINNEGEFDSELKPFLVSKNSLFRKEREVMQKDHASHFRKKLEDKAILLRELSYKAEQMQVGNSLLDEGFVQMVIRLAYKTKTWCEGRFNRPKPYSKRAVFALYNEALHVLVAMNEYRVAYTKKEYNSHEECSFFLKTTREDMVNVKDGGDWADELRTCYYESDDGTSRTPIRSSEF
jgi:hypothetical protein